MASAIPKMLDDGDRFESAPAIRVAGDFAVSQADSAGFSISRSLHRTRTGSDFRAPKGGSTAAKACGKRSGDQCGDPQVQASYRQMSRQWNEMAQRQQTIDEALAELLKPLK